MTYQNYDKTDSGHSTVTLLGTRTIPSLDWIKTDYSCAEFINSWDFREDLWACLSEGQKREAVPKNCYVSVLLDATKT
jgi:hypothetical protein